MAQLPKGEPAPQDGLLPEEAKHDADSRTFHAYIHVPFCLVRCGYCDFNTYTAQEIGSSSQSSFARDLVSEIEFSKSALNLSGIPERSINTVFFGGGTPTLLPAEDLIQMLNMLRENFGIDSDAEVTTEANPDSVDQEYFEKLRAAGFTRVSVGMQSAVPHVLKVLERTHNPENVSKAVLAAKAVGLQTSVDLIYGTPTESLSDWIQSLEEAIALDTDHVSAYSLIVEPGTKLARQIKSGEVVSPDEDLHAEMYEVAEAMLTKARFINYEVSNWSKTVATRSRHNLAYWNSMDWWGYGPGAHSHVGGVRWWNVKNPSAYTDRLVSNLSPALERELVDEENQVIERVMLQTRLIDGLDLSWLKSKGYGSAEAISTLLAEELIDGKAVFGQSLKLTLKGRLLADYVVRKLLD